MPRLLSAIVLTLLLGAPAVAQADVRATIIADCERDDRLDGRYTPTQMRDARNNLPADIDQYSKCREALTRALTTRRGGTGSGGARDGGGSSGGGAANGQDQAPLAPRGPAEQRALQAAAESAGSAPVKLGERSIVPGSSGVAVGAVSNDLPASLLVVLFLLAAAALAATVPLVRRRARGRDQR